MASMKLTEKDIADAIKIMDSIGQESRGRRLLLFDPICIQNFNAFTTRTCDVLIASAAFLHEERYGRVARMLMLDCDI